MRESPIDLSSEGSSDEIDLSVAKKRRFHRQLKHYDVDLAQVGDIVMATALKLDHPRYRSGDIDPGYIFFGLVKSSEAKTVDVAWSEVEVGHVQAKVKRGKDEVDYMGMICVSRSLVTVVVKYDQTNLDKLNHFIRAAIYAEFFFMRNVGWKRIQRY